MDYDGDVASLTMWKFYLVALVMTVLWDACLYYGIAPSLG